MHDRDRNHTQEADVLMNRNKFRSSPYLWAPIIICVAVMFLLTRLKVEKANAQLLKTQNMTDDDVPTVYGNV